MSNTRIKTFFYMVRNQEERERELNDFLLQDDIVVDKILQSAATGSVKVDHPEYIDGGVIITVVYHTTP